ncbi:MAG: glycoside hydrolase family 15 protein [bacterium]|nr:glycoside hydrolase family 15 protein [bacterium]
MITAKELLYVKERSIKVILEGQSPHGAYVACPNFDNYKYSWFRDGSFIADAMSRVGQIESAEKFFDWTARVIGSRKERVQGGEILRARYTLEGEESEDEWANFQLDGFGTLLWAMHEHAKRHNRSVEPWHEAIDIITAYLVKRWREPTYDWWEEESGIHPATLACLYAGLKSVGHPEEGEIKKAIDLHSARLDASLVVCATPFHAVTDETFSSTLTQIEQKLVTSKGGVHRHLKDVYYGGGEWLLLTCFLGWHYAEIGRKDGAQKKLERVASLMDEHGRLPEQVSEHMLAPEHLETWVQKWGPSARPLLWSHAMFLTLWSVLNTDKK